jgi:anti-sigma factor RsiW
MTNVELQVTDDELHAFVDGQLDPQRIAGVLRWLHEHPDDALRVGQWQTQRLELRQLHRSLDVGATPDVLTRAVMRTRRRPIWWQAAAAVVLFGIGVVAGRMGSVASVDAQLAAARAEPAFVREAVVAHAVYTPEARHPVEVTGAEEAHLVQWLGRRLGTPLKAPVLQAQGFRLLGGGLLRGEGTPRAIFFYEDARGRRVTLYVTVFEPGAAPKETAFRSAREGAFESFYWIEGRFGYALNGEVSSADVMALAREIGRAHV